MPYDGRWIGETNRPEPPQTGRWIARPRKARWLPQAFGTVFLLIQLPNWVGNLLRASGHGSRLLHLLALAFLVVVLAALAFSLIQSRASRRLRLEDRALLDGGFGDQFPAEVTIVASGNRLGTDRGVVWFADGLMGFSGKAASFVLAAGDVAPQWPKARQNGRLPEGSILLMGQPKDTYVVVTPLGDAGKAYRTRLAAFIEADEPPGGDRHWPPLAPYSESLALTADGQDAVRGGR